MQHHNLVYNNIMKNLTYSLSSCNSVKSVSLTKCPKAKNETIILTHFFTTYT